MYSSLPERERETSGKVVYFCLFLKEVKPQVNHNHIDQYIFSSIRIHKERRWLIKMSIRIQSVMIHRQWKQQSYGCYSSLTGKPPYCLPRCQILVNQNNQKHLFNRSFRPRAFSRPTVLYITIYMAIARIRRRGRHIG